MKNIFENGWWEDAYPSSYPLDQGWATVLVSGPHVGRRSPSRAELLDGSSSICSTTTIVRVALIGKQKKGLQSTHSSDVLLSTENIGEAVA